MVLILFCNFVVLAAADHGLGNPSSTRQERHSITYVPIFLAQCGQSPPRKGYSDGQVPAGAFFLLSELIATAGCGLLAHLHARSQCTWLPRARPGPSFPKNVPCEVASLNLPSARTHMECLAMLCLLEPVPHWWCIIYQGSWILSPTHVPQSGCG